jgi:hypothetical protein
MIDNLSKLIGRPMRNLSRNPSNSSDCRLLSAVLLALPLLGCGGGGGDSGSIVAPAGATVLQITASNYQAVAQESLSAAFYLLNSADLVTGAQVLNDKVPLSFARAQIGRLPAWFASVPKLATGVVYTQTGVCSGGGSLTVTVNDANGNQNMDVGDSATVLAVNCLEGGNSMNGALAFNLNTLTGDLASNVYAVNMTMSITNLVASTTAGTVTGNGSMIVAMTSTALNASKVSLTSSSFATSSSFGGVTSTRALQDFTLTETRSPTSSGFSSSTEASGNFTSSALESKTITLRTIQPFVRASSDSYPASGQATASGLNASQARVTAQTAATLLIELDADGNGVYEASTSKLWIDML